MSEKFATSPCPKCGRKLICLMHDYGLNICWPECWQCSYPRRDKGTEEELKFVKFKVRVGVTNEEMRTKANRVWNDFVENFFENES
tara:strand:+ start:36 stop:293 length:258 start_codon:yes stop_codon:yes gene_type:complete